MRVPLGTTCQVCGGDDTYMVITARTVRAVCDRCADRPWEERVREAADEYVSLPVNAGTADGTAAEVDAFLAGAEWARGRPE